MCGYVLCRYVFACLLLLPCQDEGEDGADDEDYAYRGADGEDFSKKKHSEKHSGDGFKGAENRDGHGADTFD